MDSREPEQLARELATRLLASAAVRVDAAPPPWHVPIPHSPEEAASLRVLRFVLAERDALAERDR